MNQDTDNTDEFDKPSKSQRKRDMDALRLMADRLTTLSADQLISIGELDIIDAVKAAKKITKGNARKRQIQYIAKLLSRIDVTGVQIIIDELDASSAAYIQKFHQLEIWRERLIDDDADTLSEIYDAFPNCDRQHLRQLTRSAITERQRGQQQVNYRKLFQFLKSLDSNQ